MKKEFLGYVIEMKLENVQGDNIWMLNKNGKEETFSNWSGQRMLPAIVFKTKELAEKKILSLEKPINGEMYAREYYRYSINMKRK